MGVVRALVERQLAVFRGANDPRIRLEGTHFVIGPDATRAIGMALHELATNACKYGALSSASGGVAIAWGANDQQFWMSWREHGGPPVAQPTRAGFGRRVIENMVAMSTDGKVALKLQPEGIEWRLREPLSTVARSPAQ